MIKTAKNLDRLPKPSDNLRKQKLKILTTRQTVQRDNQSNQQVR